MKINWNLILIFSFVFAYACSSPEVKTVKKADEKEIKKLIQIKNQENIGIEDQQIEDYLNRRNWKFLRTKSGLWYFISKNGAGIEPITGDRVELEYSLSLIRGEQIYSSKNDKPLNFTIDQEDVPSGLNEFVKMMKVGDHAKLIVPSYLGFGVTGDDKKIPARATLFYELQLVRIIN